MTPTITLDLIPAVLCVALALGVSVSWAFHQGRQFERNQIDKAEEERQVVLRASSLYHQRPQTQRAGRHLRGGLAAPGPGERLGERT